MNLGEPGTFHENFPVVVAPDHPASEVAPNIKCSAMTETGPDRGPWSHDGTSEGI